MDYIITSRIDFVGPALMIAPKYSCVIILVQKNDEVFTAALLRSAILTL